MPSEIGPVFLVELILKRNEHVFRLQQQILGLLLLILIFGPTTSGCGKGEYETRLQRRSQELLSQPPAKSDDEDDYDDRDYDDRDYDDRDADDRDADDRDADEDDEDEYDDDDDDDDQDEDDSDGDNPFEGEDDEDDEN